jgi:hypothetical protein
MVTVANFENQCFNQYNRIIDIVFYGAQLLSWPISGYIWHFFVW